MTFSHTDRGTDESAWAASGLPALAELPLGPAEFGTMRFVVLAAHPDDESLGAGGLLSLLHSLGADVDVLLCTAGERSHPDSTTTTPEQLAAVRTEEFGSAMEVLGLAGRWRFLALPDGGLHERKAEICGQLRETINRPAGNPRPAVSSGQPQRLAIVAPYRADGHPDHDAVGNAAAQVALEDGHALLEYPIWYWLWASPEDAVWRSWARLPLAAEQQASKAAAMGAHASQTRPLSALAGDEALLGEGFLKHFQRPFETFAYSRATPPSAPHTSVDAQRIFDEVHSESVDPWEYTTSWYERRKRSMTLAALPREKYESGLEIGCSIGTLTAELARRCAVLLAVDASSAALKLAAQRLAPFRGVTTRQLTLPAEWPEGRYDLIVVSEVGYYLAPPELDGLLERIQSSMAPGGTLLLCHWRHPISGWELDGDSVHAVARNKLRWRTAGLYQERDFVLEILVAPGDPGSSGA